MRLYALVFSFILIFTPIYSYAFVPMLFQAGRVGFLVKKGANFKKVNDGKKLLSWVFGVGTGVGIGKSAYDLAKDYCLKHPDFCYNVFKDLKDELFSDDNNKTNTCDTITYMGRETRTSSSDIYSVSMSEIEHNISEHKRIYKYHKAFVSFDESSFQQALSDINKKVEYYRKSKAPFPSQSFNVYWQAEYRYNNSDTSFFNKQHASLIVSADICSETDIQKNKEQQITQIINNLSQTEVNTIIKNHVNDIDFNEYCKGDNACATLSDNFGNEVMKGGYDVDLINEKNCVVENNMIVSCEYAKTVQDDETDDTTNNNDDEKGQGDDDKFIECSNSPFHQKICDFIDWYQDDSIKTDKDTKIDIKDISQDVKLDKDKVKFTASCPLDETHNISYGGVGIPITISYLLLCDGMSKLKPFIVGLSGLTSVMIIMGRR